MTNDSPAPSPPSTASPGMAARVHGFDWAATRLGPRAAWPLALRAVIETVLRSGMPGIVLTGDDLIVCAYNDAYVALLGGKPDALGHRMTEVWGEGADVIGPQMAAAQRGETVWFHEALFRLDRGNGLRDAWFDYSFSPIVDETGAIIGVLNSGVEVTERVLTRLAREALEAARVEREAAFERAVETARTGWMTIEPDSDEVTMDARALRLCGLPPESAVLSIEAWLGCLHSDDRDRFAAQVGAALASGDAFSLDYRIVRPNGETRHVHGRFWRLSDMRGHNRYLRGLLIDETAEWLREDERETMLRLALSSADAGWIASTASPNRPHFDARAREFFGLPQAPAPLSLDAIRARLHPDDRAATVAAFDRVLASSGRYELHYRVGGHDEPVRHIVERGFSWPGGPNRAGRFFALVFDETEAAHREARRELMIEELNHRVKNMLAVVQGIAGETFHDVPAAQSAFAAFEERLDALAAAHDLVVHHDGESTDLRTLIGASIQLNGASPRVTLIGPDVRVSARRAVGLAMACHELGTNALKYGALSTHDGHVAVEWSLEPGPPRRLAIIWRESGGPPVSPPARRGFGTYMIEEALGAEFDDIALDFRPEGLVCRIAGNWPDEEDGS